MNGFVRVMRDRLLESRHRIHAALVTPTGSLLASLGDPGHRSFLRSSAKSFQALGLPSVLAQFGLDARHHAVAMASHNGEMVHVQTVQEMLESIGMDQTDLVCGTHEPIPSVAAALREAGQSPNNLHNNCSGKHAGFLTVCKARGWDHHGYHLPEHPLQLEVLTNLKALTQCDEIETATDGCSVPCFRMPLTHVALGMTRLSQPQSAPEQLQDALEASFQAMRTHPYLIAGQHRIDTDLMTHLPNIGSKIGAEAFFVIALRNSPFGPLGIAMKIEDGSERARDVAMLELLTQLGVVERQDPRFALYRNPVLRNVAGLEVGEINADFKLEFHDQALASPLTAS